MNIFLKIFVQCQQPNHFECPSSCQMITEVKQQGTRMVFKWENISPSGMDFISPFTLYAKLSRTFFEAQKLGVERKWFCAPSF